MNEINEEEYKQYNLDIMNTSLEIKSVLRATIFKTLSKQSNCDAYNMLFNKLLKTKINNELVFNKDTSNLEWFETENAFGMNLEFLKPYPDFKEIELIKREISSRFFYFLVYNDSEMLRKAGLTDKEITFLNHNPYSTEFMYNIFFLGTSVTVMF